ncbi:MAG TPA: AAA family ATPase [Myxococcota bacterium]|nr:AAA family ATPase [Myxococcota bacterium]
MTSETVEAAPQPPPASTPPPLLAVLAAKGGCGATTIALEVAALSAAAQRTCLIDLDSCKGDLAGYLDLRSGRSLNPLLERIDVLDEVLLLGAVDVHPSGLHVLSQPYELTELYTLSAEDVARLLRFVRPRYERVVVDVGSRVDAAALATLMEASDVVVVTTPDVIALRDAQRVLRLLRRLGRPMDRVQVALNEVGGPGVERGLVEEQLGVRVLASLPHDPTACHKAASAGRLLADAAPHAPITRALGDLWRRFLDPDASARGPQWPWSAARGGAR